MMSYQKYFYLLFLSLIPGGFVTAQVDLLVDDLPFIEDAPGLGEFLAGAFRLTLSVAILASVVIIVLNGIRYMTSDAIGGKEDAKSWIRDVIWGLVLAFSSVLILSTINPDLTKFEFLSSLRALREDVEVSPGGGGDGDGEPGDGIPNEAEEMGIRSALGAEGITFSRPCKVGEETQAGCVTLWGLPQGAISGLYAIRDACEGGCSIRITGGVEGGHSSHGPGLPMVDLNRSADLTGLIYNEGTFIRNTCLGPLFSYNGSQFLDERGGGPHWHACFGTSCRFKPGC